jgi:hypothetical protein
VDVNFVGKEKGAGLVHLGIRLYSYSRPDLALDSRGSGLLHYWMTTSRPKLDYNPVFIPNGEILAFYNRTLLTEWYCPVMHSYAEALAENTGRQRIKGRISQSCVEVDKSIEDVPAFHVVVIREGTLMRTPACILEL